MARVWFGGSAADVVWTPVVGPGYLYAAMTTATVTMWSAQTGGTQLTDLLDSAGSPITSVTPNSLGQLPRFQGPDGVTVLWAQTPGQLRTRLVPQLDNAVASAQAAANGMNVSLARTPDALVTGTVTRDSNGAATSAAVTWPDGSPGTYTADTLSTAFPGAVDGYHITYGSPVTKTYTQPTITRDATTGAATVVPAIVVS